jgi:hypothetical protein
MKNIFKNNKIFFIIFFALFVLVNITKSLIPSHSKAVSYFMNYKTLLHIGFPEDHGGGGHPEPRR